MKYPIVRSIPMKNYLHQFWLKVWPRGDCWEWRGTRRKTEGFNYGWFPLGLENLPAHQFAYELAKGSLPPGLVIDHLCRHPWCVKPSHLEAVTSTVNLRRGNSISNKFRNSPSCPNGHSYTESNTMWVRCCKKCMWKRSSNYRKRKTRMKAILGR